MATITKSKSASQISWPFKLGLAAIFFVVCYLDRLSKNHVPDLMRQGKFGPIFFEPHDNAGFILQTLSQSSAFARVVFVCSLYGFLFFGYFLIQTLLPEKLPKLRVGMTLFFAAISGNCYDRAFFGTVNDFICYYISDRTVYFNVADIFMWIGFGLTLISLYQNDKEIWHPNSKRKKFLVDSAYQYRWAMQASIIAFSSAFILVLFSYTFILNSPGGHAWNGVAYLMSAGALVGLFSAIVFFVGVVYSHRSVGPLVAFERYVDSLLKGEKTQFTLRKGDEHQDYLERVAKKLKDRLET